MKVLEKKICKYVYEVVPLLVKKKLAPDSLKKQIVDLESRLKLNVQDPLFFFFPWLSIFIQAFLTVSSNFCYF